MPEIDGYPIPLVGQIFPRSEINPFQFNEETGESSIHMIIKLDERIYFTSPRMICKANNSMNHLYWWNLYSFEQRSFYSCEPGILNEVAIPCEMIAERFPEARVNLDIDVEYDQWYIKISITGIKEEIRNPENFLKTIMKRFASDAKKAYRRKIELSAPPRTTVKVIGPNAHMFTIVNLLPW